MIAITASNARARKAELGQFLTPPHVAELMASFFGPLPPIVRLLDPGAGAGSLTSAFVSMACRGNNGIRAIRATVVEIDSQILPDLQSSLERCAQICAGAGIGFECEIENTDFIESMTKRIVGEFFEPAPGQFDAAILNPPYRKIGSDSRERNALRRLGVETSNLYAGFMAVTCRLLAREGQMVAITPRSFCNGTYFRDFRKDLLANMQVRRLHTFESRRAAFQGDGVLQENLILHAVKSDLRNEAALISASSGRDGSEVVARVVPFSEVVSPKDPEQFIHIPLSSCAGILEERRQSRTSNLAALGISVSTGRVVDFRLKEFLRSEPGKGGAPLIYPSHMRRGGVVWPQRESKKPNAIADNENTRMWLVPNGRYVLMKRFTSKEEPRRLVACVLEPEEFRAPRLGFENHLNYFHVGGAGLDRGLAYGLFAYLNSSAAEAEFRRFSGHTQVNANDLRKLRYPSLEALHAMGGAVKRLDMSQSEIDEAVEANLDEARQTA